jgi:two-component system, NtrC family, sensor kinase
LLEEEKLETRSAEYVNKIFKQAQRTHRVVQNLLSFARQRKPETQQFDVVKVLEEALLLSDYEMKVGGIQLERQIDAVIPAVSGDPHQLEQVFLNIINNAVDAMRAEEKSEQQERRLKVGVSSDDHRVHIEFQDSGPGLKEPHRIFEPFYTTKNVGKGTGLGLSICYGIIKEHGGEISGSNQEGGGAVIAITLPSVGHAAFPGHATPVSQPRKAALEGTILVVEDEESVLDFERDVLSGAGAAVVTASSIENMKAALERQPFDGIILNGKMPGSNGVAETCRWIGERWPELLHRCLFTFSSLAEAEVRSFLEESHIPFLIKPFEVVDLIQNLRKLMAKSQAAVAR